MILEIHTSTQNNTKQAKTQLNKYYMRIKFMKNKNACDTFTM